MKHFLWIFLSFFTLPLFGQVKINTEKKSVNSNTPFQINWSTGSFSGKTYFSFPEAIYPAHLNLLPAYPIYNIAPQNASSVSATLINDVWADLTSEELKLINRNSVSESANIVSSIATSKKEKYYTLEIPALRRTLNGKIQKLIAFDVKTEFDYASFKAAPAATFASNSVLSSGSWYKVGVTKNGIYKITYSQLEKLGIDPATINLSTLGLFGQPAGLLPFLNSAPKKDDLKEIHIHVEGGSDGSFDQNDYILFYGEDPGKWELNSNTYSFKPHLYSDTTYYFLTTDAASGLRIQNATSVSGTPTHTVSSYDDYRRHELEKLNFLKSGRKWYGESFEINSVQQFPFYFKNIDPSTPANVKISVMQRSQDPGNQFNIKVNQDNFTMKLGTTDFSNTYDYYGIDSVRTYLHPSPTENILVELSYQKTPNSLAWLDYIELNVRRKLIFNSEPLFFRDKNSAGPGNIVQFNVLNVPGSLWLLDVTDPLHPKKITHNSGSFVNYADTIRNYVFFSLSQAELPQLYGKVENQNLHNLTQQDMLIVVHPDLISPAEDLASVHINEGLSVAVVTTTQVYNEFSAGTRDISAIRNFMKMFYDRATTPAEMPKYLLLFGDGSFDNKGRAANLSNLIPTWQSEQSLHPIFSIVSDDYYGMLDDNEGLLTVDKLDISIGRFPVKSTTEAFGIVKKIKHYLDPVTMKPWRNLLTFIGDDENGSIWVDNTEDITDAITLKYPEYDIDKIYLDAYRQEYTPGGQRYPEAKDGFVRRVDKGTLILNYIGHGGETGLAHEQILSVNDINNWTNINNLPLFFTATCEFSRFDDHSRTSAGEYVLLNPNGGGIGLLTTVRVVFGGPNQNLNEQFFKIALETDNGIIPTMGDLYYQTKSPFNDPNSRSFTLLGDPALKLAYPKENVTSLTMNNVNITSQVDTIQALSKVTVKGELTNLSGQKMTNFNGVIYPTVYDKISNISTLSNDGPSNSPKREFELWKNIIYKGKASVTNGEFSFSFIVPKDINYEYGIGRISYYAENGTTDAHGYTENFVIGGTDTSAIADNTGPEVKLYMNDTKFIFGGITNENPNLLGILFDDHGINTSGSGIGHDITAVLDGNTSKTIVLNDYYESDLDSYQSGRVIFPFKELEEGRHTLKLKAWDVYNNSAEAYTEFVVAKSASIALDHVLNYPNPFTTYTEFWFEHNQPSSSLDVQIQVFTISGKLVKTLEAYVNTEGFRAEPIPWDGRDDFGDKIGRGVYVYRLKVRGEDGSYADKFEKLVILQ